MTTFKSFYIFDAQPPTTPVNLFVGAGVPASSEFIITWDASTDNVKVKGYLLYRDGAEVANLSGLTFTDTGLLELTEYTYEIEAYDTAGNVSVRSSPVSNTTSEGTAPSIPTNLTVVPSGATESQLTSSWDSSTDNIAVTGYKLFRDGIEIMNADVLSYNDTGLSDGTTYLYSVLAYDAAGNESDQSAGVTGLTDTVGGAVIFDGTTNYSYTETQSPIMDGKELSFSFWINYVQGFQHVLRLDESADLTSTGSVVGSISFAGGASSNALGFSFEDVSGNFQSGTYIDTTASMPVNQWTCVMVSVNTASDTVQIYYNDVAKTGFNTRIVNNVNMYAGNHYVRVGFLATINDSFLKSHFSNLWFDDSFIDFSVEANRRKFLTAAGTPEDLGLTGELPTGVQAKIFLEGGTSEWNTGSNKGASPDLTVNTSYTQSDRLPVQTS